MKPPQTSKGFREAFSPQPGMYVHVADFRQAETTQRRYESTRHLLRFHFHIAAGGYWQVRSSHRTMSESRLILYDRFSTVMFYPELEGKMYLAAGHRQFHLSIHISPTLLTTYLGEGLQGLPEELRAICEGSANKGFAQEGALFQAMSTAIRQFLDCPYTGATRLLFMESKIIELIAHKFAQIQSPDCLIHAPITLRSGDIERIRYAKEILARDLESPPKLSDLARAVGTNHCSLNKGFREIFGTTAFGCLRAMRLIEAKRLLEEEGMNVTESALSVGYNSIPSFSRAFSEFFGQRPSVFQKRKGYRSAAIHDADTS